MKGPVPAVDAEDLKKAWLYRREITGGSIDVAVYQKLCKQGADAFAVGYRATLLGLLIQVAPPEQMKPYMNGEELTDDFLAAFAKTPLDYERCTVHFPLH
jgi:hypothetical protein